MSFVEAICKKRDGKMLAADEIRAFVRGATAGSIPPEQLAAMLMAICWRGMSAEETRCLTEEMLCSGEAWQLAEQHPEAVDKHSTGGVGDTVSLILAPLLASVGIPVAMMAGRGLAHTQGTVDKLEAIPGFDLDRDREGMLGLLSQCGAAIIAQNQAIAPADRVLYALRDVTGTVPSLPLIVGSIMSKKLALGAGTLILDVKWGSGAFNDSVARARELATALRQVARDLGIRCQAMITDMNQPLGTAIGTACEVRATCEVLSGGGEPRLRQVCLALAEEAMVLRGGDRLASRAALEEALAEGSALAAWQRLVRAHGGDPDPERLALPQREEVVTAGRAGYLVAVDGAALGWVATALGAGRRQRGERIDPAGGVMVHAAIGDPISPGQPLATLQLGTRPVDVEAAAQRVGAAFVIGDEPVEAPQLVLGRVDEVDGESW